MPYRAVTMMLAVLTSVRAVGIAIGVGRDGGVAECCRRRRQIPVCDPAHGDGTNQFLVVRADLDGAGVPERCAWEAFPFFWALDTGSPVLIAAALVLATGIVIPAMLAASGSFFAQQFPTEVRASGLGTGREAGGIGGGLAPLLAVALIAVTPGNAPWPVSIMFLASAVCILLGVMGNQGPKVASRSAGAASTSSSQTDIPERNISADLTGDETGNFIHSTMR